MQYVAKTAASAAASANDDVTILPSYPIERNCSARPSQSQKMSESQLTHLEIQNLLEDRTNLPDQIVVKDQPYTLIGSDAVGTGLHSVVWKAKDSYGRLRAIKLRPEKSYQDTTPVDEAYKASQLEPCDAFARFVDADIVELALDGERYPFACFVEHFVEGVNLHDFLKDSSEQVSPSFFREYVRGLCTGLRALYDLHLRHNDLHPGNVLIAGPRLGDLSAERRIQIVDTGNIRSSTPQTYDDHRSFVEHLVLIWNTIRRRRDVVLRDRRFLAEVKPLLEQMLDEDQTIALRDPAAIVREFDSAYDRAMTPPRDESRTLSSPFEFISADHIADDRLLVDIFATSCPWLKKVSGPDPCLVTGPRGCGKSTIFRWLSLKAHLHKPVEDFVNDLKIFGIYISCSADLQNRLSWIRDDEDAAQFRNLIVHYFNLLATREVLKTLAMICRRPEREQFWGFGVTAEKAVHDFIVATIPAPQQGRLRGVSRIEYAQEIVQAELFAVQIAFQQAEADRVTTTPSFLGDLTGLLCREMPRLSQMPIAFLLDDFSTHRISTPVQTVLNQIIWERRPSHVFKLSSEKHGAVLTDELLATSELTRERLEIDCAKEYLALNDSRRVEVTTQFATDLLNNRLRAARYAGTAELLIGETDHAGESLANALAKKGQNPRPSDYHGLSCIASLCSGDVSSLLHVYSRIFELGNVTKSTATTVPAHIQDAAIVEVSRKLLDAIKTFHPYGQEMHKVVLAFGNLVRKVLQDGRRQKDGDPTQIPRIEIDEVHGTATNRMAPEQRELAWELVRRAIYIEMEPGLSRHKNVTTLRWNLRRVYLPAFRAALTKNDSVKRGPEWFELFLCEPNQACDQVFREWGKNSGERQMEIFSQTKKGDD
jgi:serine/threonine protein kinase